MSAALLISVVIFVNLLIIAVWLLLITPLMTIRIVNNVVTGRDGKLVKQSIPFRKIHFTNTIVSPEGMKRKFFKEIHSVDGETIRIHRLFLGVGKASGSPK